MLIELWERLRGYDKWIETTARFKNADVEKTEHIDRYNRVSYTYEAADTIVWTDQSGAVHEADFKVPDDSPIYMIVDGKSVNIRYNPANPDDFYYRDLLATRVHTVVKTALWALALLGFFAIMISCNTLLGRHTGRN